MTNMTQVSRTLGKITEQRIVEVETVGVELTPEQALRGVLMAQFKFIAQYQNDNNADAQVTTAEYVDFIMNKPELVSLFTKLREKDIKFEFDSVRCDISRNKIVVGINTYNWIWSWFTIEELGDELYSSFDQSYSMNTGKSQKSVSRGCKVVTELKRTLGVDKSNGYDLLAGF